MSNIIVEGFATYGLGNKQAVANAMLSGAWGAISFGGAADNSGLQTLPWDSADSDIYMAIRDQNGDNRRVLPATEDTIILSAYYAVDQLPVANNYGYMIAFRDTANSTICQLILQSTGAIELQNAANGVLAGTAGPVIVAETAAHLEMKITCSTGAFELRVNEVAVISGTGMIFGGVSHVAQISFINGPNQLGPIRTQYIGNLIIRDTSGTVNNDFVGDRRVATVFVSADDESAQGWVGQPRHRFGTGILDNTFNTTAFTDSGVICASTVQTDLGSGDFTIETSVRFQSLPTGSNKAVIFGKWDEANNRRSYQLYMGGPGLENGVTAFRISTDGTAGTVAEMLTWPWAPETDRWYHVALVRSSGELLFFIDGVQLGVPIADANTYFAGAATSALGLQDNSNSPVVNTALNGWFDEFRMSVGYARYTGGFAPPTGPFPRGSLADPEWASVAWLSGFDSGIFDESSYARTLTSKNGAVMLTPDDGQFNYQTLDKATPFDDTFIEAALIPATGILTQTAQPTAGKEVTVGTTDGSTAAVYTWRAAVATAFDVLIDTTLNGSLANLCAAINAGAGAGVKYGTGTTANFDVTADQLPVEQIEVTASTPGTGGNAIASTTNDPDGSWGGATLAGGEDIPGYSQFYMQRPPVDTTIIDSLTIVQRTFKTDAGTAQVQASLIGAEGGELDGDVYTATTVPTYHFDTFEADPDTGESITPATVISAKLRMNRTA